MATFEIVEGAPGQGKSLYSARKIRKLLKRNIKWFKQQCDFYEKYGGETFAATYNKEKPLKRKIASNIKYAPGFEERYQGWITYWSSLADLIKIRDADIIWDEIATELDSRNWVNLSSDIKIFLSQYRKRGVDIYANTQDFSMVDARARLMITSVKTLKKIAGSPDISTTKPPPKRIWGVIWIRAVMNWKEVAPEKKRYELLDLFNFMLIEKELTEIYDTRQDIPASPPLPYRHEERVCELHGKGCDHHRTLHI